MKLRMKFLAVAGTLAAVGALTSSPLTSSAAGAGAAVYEGQTGQLTPGVPLLGGTGTFSFTANCIVGAAVDTVPQVGVGGALAPCISASGSYSNIVCGTGSAAGSGPFSLTAIVGVGASSASYNSTFSITFVAGLGVITGTASGTTGTGPLVGTASLLPTNGNCVTPVSQFTVVGVLATAATA